MSSKDKNLTPVQQEYKKFAQQREPKRPVKKLYKSFFRRGFHLRPAWELSFPPFT